MLAIIHGSGCVIPVSVGNGRGDDGSGSGGGSAVHDPTLGTTSSAPTRDELSTSDTTVTTNEADSATSWGSTGPTTSESSTSTTTGESSTGPTATDSGSTGLEETTGDDDQAELVLSFSQVKQFDFSWSAVEGAEHYELLESTAPGEPFVQLGSNIVGESASFTMPLHFRLEASYVLRACDAMGCTESEPVSVVGSLAEAVGYFKAPNPEWGDRFGWSVALSSDGNTLAVGAPEEDSNATGIDGNQADASAPDSGAVYVFVRVSDQWSQQAYVKASNTGPYDQFGWCLALSGDGNTLVIGAIGEASNATGVGDDQGNDSMEEAGAAYVFVRDAMDQWSQQAYVKASNTDAGDQFGTSIALSGDGSTIAVGASGEDSNATGMDADQADDSASFSGAVYVFVRDAMDQWSQQAYVKASNTGAGDAFGRSVALSSDGHTLAVGAILEDSNATGIGGNQADDSEMNAGAAYVLVRDGNQWSQQAYVKAFNADIADLFGSSVALSGDGHTLAVGAYHEDSNATGVDGNDADDLAPWSGAAYVFVRDAMDVWSQQAYVKPSNTSMDDEFGWSVALSGDGDTLVVGAWEEDSSDLGIGGDQGDDYDYGLNSGAAYVFVRDPAGQWSQYTYVKPSNFSKMAYFGSGTALSGNGDLLVIGAYSEGYEGEDCEFCGDPMKRSGAVYLF